MISHPYFKSVPLGTSKYGEYKIQLSTRALAIRVPIGRRFEPDRPLRKPVITPGQMSPLDGIDSGPEDLRYFSSWVSWPPRQLLSSRARLTQTISTLAT